MKAKHSWDCQDIFQGVFYLAHTGIHAYALIPLRPVDNFISKIVKLSPLLSNSLDGKCCFSSTCTSEKANSIIPVFVILLPLCSALPGFNISGWNINAVK